MSATTQLFGIQNSSRGVGYSYARMPAGVWVQNAAGQSLTSGAVSFDSLAGALYGNLAINGIDNAREMWSLGDPTKIFIPVTGWYSLSLTIRHSSTSGIDTHAFTVDGVTPARVTWAGQFAENCEESSDWVYPLVAGQVVVFQVVFPGARTAVCSAAAVVLLNPGY